MGFSSYADIDESRLYHFSFSRVSSSATVPNGWFDTSMWLGSPAPNFYASAPLEAAVLNYRRGIRHTEPDPDTSEHLLSAYWGWASTTSNNQASFILGDWLLYYPFIDGDSLDPQTMTNDVTLPRSTDGVNVRPMLVSLGAVPTAGAWTMTYTNQNGVSGRVATGTTVSSTGASQVISAGAVAGASGPFMHLASGDNGVRSVESFTWTIAPSGIQALVLVKTIAAASHPEQSNFTGAETVFPHMPLIPDGACLHYLHFSANSMTNAAPRCLLTTIRS